MDPEQASGAEREGSLQASERRGGARVPVRLPVSMRLESERLEGQTQNLSRVGVLFVSAAALRVTIELEEGGRTRSLRGRLVRVQPLSATSSGYAVEFESEIELLPPPALPGG